MIIGILKTYITVVNAINEKIGVVISWLTSILVLLVCFNVFRRYVFQQSSIALSELEWHIFAVIFMLGAAYTLKDDRHVRVDVFYAKFSRRGKAWVNLFGVLLFLIPFCLIVIKGGIPYVDVSWNLNEKSSDPGGLPARYLIKSVIVAGFGLLLLQGTSLACQSILDILGVPHTSSQTQETDK